MSVNVQPYNVGREFGGCIGDPQAPPLQAGRPVCYSGIAEHRVDQQGDTLTFAHKRHERVERRVSEF